MLLVYDGSEESQDEILDSDSDSDKESRQSSTSTSKNVSHILSLTEITRYVKATVDDGENIFDMFLIFQVYA